MIIAYVGENAMGLLAGLKSDVALESKQDIVIEYIDAGPITAEVTYEKLDANITIYVRDEMHTNGNVAFQSPVKAGEILSDDEIVEVSYLVAEGINQFLTDKGMADECSMLDEDMQGVLFGVDKDGEIIAKIVEGKKRPSLLCTTLFGAPRMMRPYADEIMSQLAIGSMSFDEIEEAANSGDYDAMEQLAMTYLNGSDEIEVDPEKAYYWSVKCAEAGGEQAMFNVGLFTAKGFGVERSFKDAADWMRRAAEAGDEDAEVCAANFKNLAYALEKANDGDAQAQADLAAGLMDLGGSLEQAGDVKDYEESVMWAEKAAAQGNADGCWILAIAFHQGRGVRKDIGKAIELYQKGSEAGSDSCRHNLACEYMTGENVKQDMKKGFELIKEAAENGYGLAMRDLGQCYQYGEGTPSNMKKAVEWYKKAIEIIDDPELAQKTAVLNTLVTAESGFGGDSPGADDEELDLEDIDIDALAEEYLKTLDTVKTEIDSNYDENKSKEAVKDAVKNGEGFLKMVVKKADGTEKEVVVWGGYKVDGYDRTLNVFMKESDIGRFFEMLAEDEIDLDGVLDPCDQEQGYQITVDFMDCAAMLVVRKGEGKLSGEMYVRDEHRSCQDIIEVGTGEIDLPEDGIISLDKETFAENEFLSWTLGVIGLRRYLLKEGVVQKLYNMYDESVGVEVKVRQGGSITSKIVKGMERPDLPCEILPFGERICRPYLDELFGLKSTGIRQPWDPEYAAKLRKGAINS